MEPSGATLGGALLHANALGRRLKVAGRSLHLAPQVTGLEARPQVDEDLAQRTFAKAIRIEDDLGGSDALGVTVDRHERLGGAVVQALPAAVGCSGLLGVSSPREFEGQVLARVEDDMEEAKEEETTPTARGIADDHADVI